MAARILSLSPWQPSHLLVTDPLTNLLCAEGPDAVQAKGEDDAIFVAKADVEGKVLRRDHAALPGIAHGRG